MAARELQEKKHSKPQPHFSLEGAEAPADPMGIHTTGQGAGWDQWPLPEQDKERRRKNVLQLFDSRW